MDADHQARAAQYIHDASMSLSTQKEKKIPSSILPLSLGTREKKGQ
jgi:hypothetical protein